MELNDRRAEKIEKENRGRYIDQRVGILDGEGARQRITDVLESTSSPARPWAELPSADAAQPVPTYYDVPMVKEPVWIWTIPTYFFVGGAAGGAATLGGGVQLLCGARARNLVARCRWLAATGAAASTVLLVADLGRPTRFIYMLRVLRPTSPMNVGAWLLAAFGAASGLAALLCRASGPLRGWGDLAGTAAAVAGGPLAGYTAVLLSNSAVPLWQGTRTALPVLFVASGITSAAAVLELLPEDAGGADTIRRFGTYGALAELAGAYAVGRQAKRVARVGRPLRRGFSGVLWNAARLLSAASLLMPRRTRRQRINGALIGAAGALALRFAVFEAGKASTRDSRAVSLQQLAGEGGAATTSSPRALAAVGSATQRYAARVAD